MTTWWPGKRKQFRRLSLGSGCLIVAACLGFLAVNKMTGKPSVISGSVRGPNGQPVKAARVYFISGPVPLPEVAILTDNKGSFSLSAPAAGTYEIGCTAAGLATAMVTVKVIKGQDAKVEIQLQR